MARFGRVITAMVTPFADDGSLDIDGAVALARWLVDQGNEGLVLAGTTGESPVLTDAEKIELWRAVTEAVSVPIVAGSGSNDTAHSVQLTKEAEAAGVAGILAVTPYYNRPSQAGVAAHFAAVADATSLPVMLYDIPVRTGRKIDTDTMLMLARSVDNIVAVKDASGNPAASAALLADAPNGFELYSGDDGFTLPLLAIGAVGVIGVATHWAAAEHADMVTAFGKGDVDQAREVNARLVPSFAFETSDLTPNPLPAKAMLRVLGQPGGHCRLPNIEPPGIDLEARAREILSGLGRTSHG
ncbi:MAG: 4-hydroxy-tetrahydrodipicolinate synthase [Acidimicrobiales bacterium]